MPNSQVVPTYLDKMLKSSLSPSAEKQDCVQIIYAVFERVLAITRDVLIPEELGAA